MEEWSTFSNGPSLDSLGVKTAGEFLGNGCRLGDGHVDNGAPHGKLSQKYLFYQLYPLYLKDNCSQAGARPLLVLVDGQQLDLYKLFSLVKERGGYAEVSKNGLWGSVTKELGLNLEVYSPVKLVYDKYLNDFERWLKKIFEEKILKNGNHGCDWGLEWLPLDIEKEFRGLLCLNTKNKADDELFKSKSNKKKKNTDLVNHSNGNNPLDTKDQNNKPEDVQHIEGDNNEKSSNGIKDNPATLGAECADKECNPLKRKRDAFSGMLNWMKNIAKHPLYPLTQPIPKPSKWKEYKGRDFFGQFLKARKLLSLRKHEEPNSGLSSLQKQKMHPAMFEDPVALDRLATGKSRCRERLPSSVKSRSCSCCNPCSHNGNTLAENCPHEKTTETIDVLTEKENGESSGDESHEKQVSVGPRFQAEIPEWTGVASDSDSKWLGTRVWSWKHGTEPATTETDVGRGRQEKCSCEHQGSVACVRLHIAENRMKVKLELGSEFYHWGFDRMGEEVSLQWTTVEEKRFKDIMRSNVPSKIKYFWNNVCKYFPNRTRRQLVSYYFNVFLIQLRTYQNRATPKNIDSDDEVEFGCLSKGFGMEAVEGPGDDDFLECALSEQYIDFD
ncbi:AT-rich interactive domain-containing protein 2 [Vigna unguiculata]|uniref:AT-rich interactive domain-containing protein 2 n=1 Tax=Vigna unguiculata TaxID=3917 RepID=UPI001016219B|nr:AT-rich interactive domain-containing protein 2 [Vigna unguiculata]